MIEIVLSISIHDGAFSFKLFTTFMFSDKFGLKNIFKNLYKSFSEMFII